MVQTKSERLAVRSHRLVVTSRAQEQCPQIMVRRGVLRIVIDQALDRFFRLDLRPVLEEELALP